MLINNTNNTDHTDHIDSETEIVHELLNIVLENLQRHYHPLDD